MVVASVRAAVQRVSPSPVAPEVVSRGADVEFDELVRTLAGLGYERTDRVEARGEMAVRGGIIDDVHPGLVGQLPQFRLHLVRDVHAGILRHARPRPKWMCTCSGP